MFIPTFYALPFGLTWISCPYMEGEASIHVRITSLQEIVATYQYQSQKMSTFSPGDFIPTFR